MSEGRVPSPAIDERQPLLTADPDYDAENPVADEPIKKRSWWAIGWYTVLTLLGGFALGLFIKGFIDADDVEVCLQSVHDGGTEAEHLHLVRSWEGNEERTGRRLERCCGYVLN